MCLCVYMCIHVYVNMYVCIYIYNIYIYIYIASEQVQRCPLSQEEKVLLHRLPVAPLLSVCV